MPVKSKPVYSCLRDRLCWLGVFIKFHIFLYFDHVFLPYFPTSIYLSISLSLPLFFPPSLHTVQQYLHRVRLSNGAVGTCLDLPQWARVLATKPDNLNLNPRTHMVEREKSSPASRPLQYTHQGTLIHSNTHTYSHTHVHTHIYTIFFKRETFVLADFK